MRRAWADAEGLTGDFYCIPGWEWQRFPYEVTSACSDPEPRGAGLAELVRLRDPRSGKERFRVRLHDERILSVTEGPGAVDLYALLLYLAVHELIHVIRFVSGAAPFDLPPAAREAEERRVHALAARVLAPVRAEPLERVLALYGRRYGASPK